MPVGGLTNQNESTRNPRLNVRKEMVTTTEVDNLLIDSGKQEPRKLDEPLNEDSGKEGVRRQNSIKSQFDLTFSGQMHSQDLNKNQKSFTNKIKLNRKVHPIDKGKLSVHQYTDVYEATQNKFESINFHQRMKKVASQGASCQASMQKERYVSDKSRRNIQIGAPSIGNSSCFISQNMSFDHHNPAANTSHQGPYQQQQSFNSGYRNPMSDHDERESTFVASAQLKKDNFLASGAEVPIFHQKELGSNSVLTSIQGTPGDMNGRTIVRQIPKNGHQLVKQTSSNLNAQSSNSLNQSLNNSRCLNSRHKIMRAKIPGITASVQHETKVIDVLRPSVYPVPSDSLAEFKNLEYEIETTKDPAALATFGDLNYDQSQGRRAHQRNNSMDDSAKKNKNIQQIAEKQYPIVLSKGLGSKYNKTQFPKDFF